MFWVLLGGKGFVYKFDFNFIFIDSTLFFATICGIFILLFKRKKKINGRRKPCSLRVSFLIFETCFFFQSFFSSIFYWVFHTNKVESRALRDARFFSLPPHSLPRPPHHTLFFAV